MTMIKDGKRIVPKKEADKKPVQKEEPKRIRSNGHSSK